MARGGKRVQRCVILVDNSNVFIGGQKHSALIKGLSDDEGAHGSPCDHTWRIDFEHLRACLADDREVEAAIMVGSHAPHHDACWDPARAAGFEVISHERRPGHGEKAVDTELVARGTEIISRAAAPGVLVLCSGDLDYLPLVDVAHRHGWTVEMVAFRASFDPDGEMVHAVDRVRHLDDVFDRIGFCD
jgi:uncharacterized LabA/DUF88 family protein